MDVTRILFCMLLTWTNTATIQAREGPPVILSQSFRELYYTFYTSRVNLSCTADGSLPMTFVWEHYGAVIQNITVYNYVSNLTLKPQDTSWVAGTYTCIVGNRYGRTSSDSMELTEVMLYPSTTPNDVIYEYAPLNMPYTLRCDHPNSKIKPEVQWIKTTTTGNTPRRVQYNQRITYDTTGSLHFLYIDKSDRGGYMCNISYPVFQYYILGPTIILEPEDTGIQPTAGYPMWNSEEFPTALLGQNLTLRCVFGGNPIPQIRWQKIVEGGTIRPALNQNIQDHGRSLTFHNLNYTDHGEYECTTETQTIQFYVTVESTPVWIEKPKPIITSAGTANPFLFFCGAYGKPVPDISWYINTESATDQPNNLAISHVNSNQTINTAYSVLYVTTNVSFSLKCVCHNNHGSISSYSYLYITERVTHPPTPIPTIKTTHIPSSSTTTSASTTTSTTASTTASTTTSTPFQTTRPTPAPTPGSTPKPTSKQPVVPTQAPNKVSDSSNTAVIGGAVGAGVAVVIIIAVVYCIWSKRRQNMDPVQKYDARMGYGNRGYSGVEMDRVQKPDNRMVHKSEILQKPHKEEKGGTYTGLTIERENKKGNVYEQLGGTSTPVNVESKPEEAEYCYISDADILKAQRQSQIPTPESAAPTGVSNKEVSNSTKTKTPGVKEDPRTSVARPNSKPLPEVPPTQNPSYGKIGRFSSGKYSAVGNPAYSSQVPQLTQPKQLSAPQSYMEPITTKMSGQTTNRKPVPITPDDGYFKLEPSHVKM